VAIAEAIHGIETTGRQQTRACEARDAIDSSLSEQAALRTFLLWPSASDSCRNRLCICAKVNVGVSNAVSCVVP
jgi:hypothetical protein